MEFEKKIGSKFIIGGGSEKTAGNGSLNKAVKVPVTSADKAKKAASGIFKAALLIGGFIIKRKLKKKK